MALGNNILTSDRPIIYSFTIGEIDFVVTEISKDDEWEISVPLPGPLGGNGHSGHKKSATKKPKRLMSPGTISGNSRLLFELFLHKENPVQDIKGYSGYKADEACVALSALNGTQESWKNSFTQYIKRIRDAVLEACGKDQKHLPYEKFLDQDKDRTRHYYVWKPGVYNDYIPRDFREYSVIETKNREKTENDLGNFIDNVLSVYKNLRDFFFRDKDIPVPLQFFEMREDIFGRPKFPLTVKQGLPQPPARGDDTLLRIRCAEKRHNNQRHFVYPGLIYRLLATAKDGDWLLGQTVYTHLIESCDYLNFKIKAGWWKAKSQSDQAADDYLKNHSLAREWAKLAQGILTEQNFKPYLAGLAFSVPIFQVLEDGKLRIILAQDSNLKQADYGLHMAPAGMLEFCQDDIEEKTLSLEAFQAIVAKELVEETLVGYNFSAVADEYKRVLSFVDSGPHKSGDPYKASIVREIINNQILAKWNKVWKNPKLPSKTPLKTVLTFNPKTRPSFWIVDCFTLRPEIIMPIYIKENLPEAFNWEVEQNTAFYKEFSKWSEVTNFILTERQRLSAPGLAGLYYGAKFYFDTADKQKLLSLPRNEA
jgi:hypothetical protein